MTNGNLSGIMHCWLLCKIEVGGRTFLSLRGVNWDDRYRINRPHSDRQIPWWHTPTLKFKYDGQPPDMETALARIKAQCVEEWPALGSGNFMPAGQNLGGEWSEPTIDGKIECVTRVIVDLGHSDALPPVVLFPNRGLSFPRHPVKWVAASTIGHDRDPVLAENVVNGSPYRVYGERWIDMERPDDRNAIAVSADLPLDRFAAEGFRYAGILFQDRLITAHPALQLIERGLSRTRNNCLTASP